jgi:hypothetical protein
MRTALASRQNVVGRQRYGYLVPLHDGQPAESYLFTVSRSHAGSADAFDVMEMLAAIVVGFGATWRNGEDVQVLDLGGDDLGTLPKNMLLRDRIASADWSQPEPELVPPELVLNTARGMSLLREDVPELRKAAGVRDDGVPVSWHPVGPIWRGARALILVDLDEHNLGLAEAATSCALGDWWIASGQSHTYQFARRGQAQEWDAAHGRFFSPEETRERVERERSGAADRVGRHHYRASAIFDSKERQSVRTALRARAGRAERTAGAEWCAVRQESLSDVLAETVPSQLCEFYRGLASGPAGPERTAKQGLPALLGRLMSTARQGLHELVADRLLGTARRQRWFGGRRRPPKPRGSGVEDFVIDRMERERLAQDLTPIEVDLLEAKEHRIPLTVWAAEQSMPLSEARKLWNRLRIRLEAMVS